MRDQLQYRYATHGAGDHCQKVETHGYCPRPLVQSLLPLIAGDDADFSIRLQYRAAHFLDAGATGLTECTQEFMVSKFLIPQGFGIKLAVVNKHARMAFDEVLELFAFEGEPAE